MTAQVPAIKWVPYQGGGAGTLVAVVELDSAIDNDWIVPIVGQYQQPPLNRVTADTVVVFNQDNNATVTVMAGAVTLPVAPYQRDYLDVSHSQANAIAVHLTVGQVQLQLYKGTPPLNPSVVNYAKAVAVTNPQVVVLAIFDSAGNLLSSFNVASVTKNSTGNFTVTFDTAVSSTAAVQISRETSGSSGDGLYENQSTMSVDVRSFDGAGNPLDYPGYSLTLFA